MSDLSCIANNEIKSKLQQKFALVPLSHNKIQVNCIAMVLPTYIQCTFDNIHFLDLYIDKCRFRHSSLKLRNISICTHYSVYMLQTSWFFKQRKGMLHYCIALSLPSTFW